MSQPGTAEQFDFGRALRVLKDGGCVTRGGWNGAHMCLVLIPGSHFEVSAGRPLAVHLPVGTPVDYRAHIDMLTADGSLVPWLASQSDVLAEDWQEANLACATGSSAVNRRAPAHSCRPYSHPNRGRRRHECAIMGASIRSLP